MVNNPFRGKPISKAEQKIKEWGKVKFKPTKFGSGGKNHFKNPEGCKGNEAYNRKFGNHSRNSNKNKDSYKFNQVAKDAKPENATPWNKYKDEIVYKQREDEQAALQANMDSEEAKLALKQREINYRKLLIEQKKKEPTQWESFEGEDDTDKKKCNSSLEGSKVTAKNKKLKTSKNIKSSELDFPKNLSNSQVSRKDKELIPQEFLNNFDSTKLSYEQNDKIRKIITKTTTMAYGSSLKMTIKDMKRKKSKKDKA